MIAGRACRIARSLLAFAWISAVQTPALRALVQGPASEAEDRAHAAHVLKRLTYGPRPGDVDRVLSMGIDRFVEQQLAPEQIPEPLLERDLARFEVLRMSRAELAGIFRSEVRARRERQRAMREDSTRVAPRATGRRARASRMRRLVGQLQQATVIRAVRSERQLYEIMVDFWTNHFNVFLAKGAGRFLTPSYVEEVIRPRALGTFEDLVTATATSPAMLVYLDNASSVRPGSEPPQLARARRAMARGRAPIGGRASPARIDSMLRRAEERRPRGINENYARELLELHTLGVDGGYEQQDVVAVARIFTGWSVTRPAAGADYTFNEWAHDYGEKTVLGRRFPAGRGVEEGLELLRALAGHPATMTHVSSKLCQRFVSDDPPSECIGAAVAAWLEHDGDIRAVLRAIVTDPSFHAPEHRGAKTKTPLEFLVSALRATAVEPDTTLRLAQVVARLGQPLFLYQQPTGYPERAESWVSAGALVERLNVAVALAAGRLPGAERPVARPRAARAPEDIVGEVNRSILGGEATPHTLRVIRQKVGAAQRPADARAIALGLALGSPEFQRQ